MPLNQLNFVVSINSDAVPAALNNDQFRKTYGSDNPNLKLIDELKQAGVKVTICVSQWPSISWNVTGLAPV